MYFKMITNVALLNDLGKRLLLKEHQFKISKMTIPTLQNPDKLRNVGSKNKTVTCILSVLLSVIFVSTSSVCVNIILETKQC